MLGGKFPAIVFIHSTTVLTESIPIPLLGQGYDSPWCNTQPTATLIHEH